MVVHAACQRFVPVTDGLLQPFTLPFECCGRRVSEAVLRPTVVRHAQCEIWAEETWRRSHRLPASGRHLSILEPPGQFSFLQAVHRGCGLTLDISSCIDIDISSPNLFPNQPVPQARRPASSAPAAHSAQAEPVPLCSGLGCISGLSGADPATQPTPTLLPPTPRHSSLSLRHLHHQLQLFRMTCT